MGKTSLPREVRKLLRPLIDNAILDSRHDESMEIDIGQAAEMVRERIFASVEVRISILGEAGSLAPYIHDAGVPSVLFRETTQRVEQLKVDLAGRDENEMETINDLRDECYAELLAYRLKGRRTAVTKFVGDMALWEMREVDRQYNRKKTAAAKRQNYAAAIVAKLEEAGASEETTISAAIAEPVGV